MASSEKRYIIFAGVNGSGKSTLYNLHPEYSHMPRINVDEIVKKYGSWQDISAQMKAGRDAVKLLHECLNSNQSFNQETTLCGKSIVQNIQKAKKEGFIVEIHYIGVDSVEICKSRIKYRVSCGGHDIPDEDVERRYHDSLNRIRNIMDLCDEIFFYDNTDQFSLIAVYKNQKIDIRNSELPTWFKNIISNLTPEQLKELMFTPEELEELKAAREMPFVYDEDCPPVTAERARNFHRVNKRRDTYSS